MTIGRVANLSKATEAQMGKGPGRVPVPVEVFARLSVRGLFQYAILYPAPGGQNRAAHPASRFVGSRDILRCQSANSGPRGCAWSITVTMNSRDYFAKVIFVCGSTVSSAALLLNSKSNRFPNGLGNDSEQLGHNLMDHHFQVGAEGNWEGDLDKYYYGRRANGIYIPR